MLSRARKTHERRTVRAGRKLATEEPIQCVRIRAPELLAGRLPKPSAMRCAPGIRPTGARELECARSVIGKVGDGERDERSSEQPVSEVRATEQRGPNAAPLVGPLHPLVGISPIPKSKIQHPKSYSTRIFDASQANVRSRGSVSGRCERLTGRAFQHIVLRLSSRPALLLARTVGHVCRCEDL